jgi:hypothetical protein
MSLQSSISDALGASIVAGLDPNAQMIKQFGDAQIENVRVSAGTNKLALLKELQQTIDEGKANGMDGRVVEGYRRMFDSFIA